MLIRKAVGLCESVQDFWGRNDFPGGLQWTILLQEILGELLAGVTDKENETAKSISDLYVFLLAQVYQSARDKDAKKLRQVQEVLQIEQTTWELFVQKEMKEMGEIHSESISGAHSSVGAPLGDFHSEASSFSLNLEA